MLPTNDFVEMDSFLDQDGSSLRNSHPARRVHKYDYAIGIGFILIVTLLWTWGSFVTQDLFGSGYDKPFLLSYINQSTHSLCLILVLIRYWWNRNKKERMVSEYYIPLVADDDNDISGNPTTFQSEHPLLPLTTRQTARLACIFCFIAFIGSWAVNSSLGLTTVASSTIISSIGAFFTLIIGRVFRVETLGLVKVGAVIMSFTGVLFVSLSDSTSQSPTTSEQSLLSLEAVRSRAMLGDALALISALFGAICVIFQKVRIKDESRVDMQLFYGLVGLFNMLLLWPIGLVLHLTGAEKFGLPRTKQDLYAIMVNMAISVSADYLCTFAMLKTTPLVLTVGLSLTIPFAVVAEFLRKTAVHATVIVGAILVIASFVVIGLDNSRKKIT